MEYSLSDLKSVSGKGRTVIVFSDWGLHIDCTGSRTQIVSGIVKIVKESGSQGSVFRSRLLKLRS